MNIRKIKKDIYKYLLENYEEFEYCISGNDDSCYGCKFFCGDKCFEALDIFGDENYNVIISTRNKKNNKNFHIQSFNIDIEIKKIKEFNITLEEIRKIKNLSKL